MFRKISRSKIHQAESRHDDPSIGDAVPPGVCKTLLAKGIHSVTITRVRPATKCDTMRQGPTGWGRGWENEKSVGAKGRGEGDRPCLRSSPVRYEFR